MALPSVKLRPGHDIPQAQVRPRIPQLRRNLSAAHERAGRNFRQNFRQIVRFFGKRSVQRAGYPALCRQRQHHAVGAFDSFRHFGSLGELRFFQRKAAHAMPCIHEHFCKAHKALIAAYYQKIHHITSPVILFCCAAVGECGIITAEAVIIHFYRRFSLRLCRKPKIMAKLCRFASLHGIIMI